MPNRNEIFMLPGIAYQYVLTIKVQYTVCTVHSRVSIAVLYNDTSKTRDVGITGKIFHFDRKTVLETYTSL